MGTLNFTVTSYGREGNKNVTGTGYRTSGDYTTSTSASFVEDASADIELRAGEVIEYTASTPMWVRFGGSVAAVGVGFYAAQDVTYYREVTAGTTGKVSAIDVS